MESETKKFLNPKGKKSKKTYELKKNPIGLSIKLEDATYFLEKQEVTKNAEIHVHEHVLEKGDYEAVFSMKTDSDFAQFFAKYDVDKVCRDRWVIE